MKIILRPCNLLNRAIEKETNLIFLSIFPVYVKKHIFKATEIRYRVYINSQKIEKILYSKGEPK